MSSLRWNVVANYAGKLWSIASVYVFVPVYLRILGLDAYGLIAFNAVALALLFVADAGLSSSFAREAAKGLPSQELLDVLVSIERVLFGILGTVCLIFALCAPLIADHWLKSAGALPRELVVQSLGLMPLALMPQIAMALYFGGLMGLQRQVTANLLSTGFSIARSGLVIIPILLMPDVRLFFIWQAVASVVMTWVMRQALLRAIEGEAAASRPGEAVPRGRFSWLALRPIRYYALGMLGMSIIAGLNTQLDKLIVSKMLALQEFAQYSLAATLAQVPYILTLPIATALLPRLTSLLEQQRKEEFTSLYRGSSYYIACVGAVSGAGLILFADDVLAIWMRGQTVAPATAGVVRLLAAGSILLTLQLAPFQLSLANGHNATNVRLGLVVLVFSIPFQIFMTTRHGLLGAATPWLVVNGLAFAYLGVVLNRMFAKVPLHTWFIADNLKAVVLAALPMVAARYASNAMGASAWASCGLAALGALLALAIAHYLRTRLQIAAPQRASCP